MSTRRSPSLPVTTSAHPMAPRCHGGASSLLRMGLGATPQRMAPAGWLGAERPLLLQQRLASMQLSLFGAPGGR